MPLLVGTAPSDAILAGSFCSAIGPSGCGDVMAAIRNRDVQMGRHDIKCGVLRAWGLLGGEMRNGWYAVRVVALLFSTSQVRTTRGGRGCERRCGVVEGG